MLAEAFTENFDPSGLLACVLHGLNVAAEHRGVSAGEMTMPLTLEQIAQVARDHKVTPDERRAQRVSMIMGLRSEKSTLTREKISDYLSQMEGHNPAEKDADRKG